MLLVQMQADTRIKNYNKNAIRENHIPVSKSAKIKLDKASSIQDSDNKPLVDEIIGFLELKIYFDSNQIKEREINRKLKKLLEELKKIHSDLEIIYKDIVFFKDKVVFFNIASLQQYEQYLQKEALWTNKIYYRGQSNINWSIKPSIFRGDWIINEKNFIKEMVVMNSSEFVNSNTTLEKLTKMQHYKAPTRLLDLTKNPLIALYFACEKDEKNDDDTYGEIVFIQDKGNTKYYDSDTVSILSNISMMETDFTDDVASLGKLTYQIQFEKPTFTNDINGDDLHKCLITHVKLDNKRIMNQQGLFLLVGIGKDKLEPAKVLDYIYKKDDKLVVFLVPANAKKEILNDLNRFSINKGFVYPEIDDVAEYLKNEVYRQ
jgi:hypothetical protein